MSTEALVEGTSAKRAETTPVMLKSALPHKMQNRPQNSLPLTPRLPIEGEPNECKQEVADSIMTAGRTNGMVGLAEPTKIMDINEKAALGGEPVERACVIDEGDGMERKDLRLPKAELYHEEINQHSGNANGDIPVASGLLLEGEWTVNQSGRKVEPADTPNKLEQLVALSIELEDPRSGGIPCVHLRGMTWRAGDANSIGD